MAFGVPCNSVIFGRKPLLFKVKFILNIWGLICALPVGLVCTIIQMGSAGQVKEPVLFPHFCHCLHLQKGEQAETTRRSNYRVRRFWRLAESLLQVCVGLGRCPTILPLMYPRKPHSSIANHLLNQVFLSQ